MTYILSNKDKEWIEKAINLDLTQLQVVRKLQEVNYPDERIEAFLEYYENNKKKEVEDEKETGLGIKRKDNKEDEFEENVKSYFGKNNKSLSWNEKRVVKRWLGQCDKYSKIMKKAIEGFKKEIENIEKKDLGKEKFEKEMNYLKKEIIDRLIESKGILEVEHPITKEEITKENLKDLDINILIELLEENVESLDMIVNGKLT